MKKLQVLGARLAQSKGMRVAAASTLLAAGAAHAAVDAAVGAAITSASTDILSVIALGGAAFITIAGAGVVWNVASKFIKRLGGKA